MLSIVSKLTAIVNGAEHIYQCLPSTPIADVKDALFQFIGYIAKVEEQAKAQTAPVADSVSPVPVEAPAVVTEPVSETSKVVPISTEGS